MFFKYLLWTIWSVGGGLVSLQPPWGYPRPSASLPKWALDWRAFREFQIASCKTLMQDFIRLSENLGYFG